MKEKTYVDDIDRNIYDFKNDDKDTYKQNYGVTPEIAEKVSRKRNNAGLEKEVKRGPVRRRMTLLGCRISGLSHYRYIII